MNLKIRHGDFDNLRQIGNIVELTKTGRKRKTIIPIPIIKKFPFLKLSKPWKRDYESWNKFVSDLDLSMIDFLSKQDISYLLENYQII